MPWTLLCKLLALFYDRATIPSFSSSHVVHRIEKSGIFKVPTYWESVAHIRMKDTVRNGPPSLDTLKVCTVKIPITVIKLHYQHADHGHDMERESTHP